MVWGGWGDRSPTARCLQSHKLPTAHPTRSLCQSSRRPRTRQHHLAWRILGRRIRIASRQRPQVAAEPAADLACSAPHSAAINQFTFTMSPFASSPRSPLSWRVSGQSPASAGGVIQSYWPIVKPYPSCSASTLPRETRLKARRRGPGGRVAVGTKHHVRFFGHHEAGESLRWAPPPTGNSRRQDALADAVQHVMVRQVGRLYSNRVINTRNDRWR